MQFRLHVVLAILPFMAVPVTAFSYPTDAGKRTEIRRLDWQRDIDAGRRKGSKNAPGGRLSSEQIVLRMTAKGADFDLTPMTPKDQTLQAGLEQILERAAWSRYNVAILDISDPARPRFAGVNEAAPQTPGSVAKVLVAAAILRSLRERFGDDVAAREAFLKQTDVPADGWLMPNSHEVPVIRGDAASVRSVRHGDTFTLWEWMDHAMSPSSNAAATLVWREAVFMDLLGKAYPPAARNDALFKTWSRKEFTEATFAAVDRPLQEAGLVAETARLRTYFTKGAGKYIHSSNSRMTPLGILQWMVRVEQGRMVDRWSSLELKRLLYLTRRRVRYVHAKALAPHAVFFKSGSLYECKKEPGYVCGKYRGNVVNVLNSLVGVETADGKHQYLVAVMSNELRKNAATDHARLAAEVHRLVTESR